LIGRFDPHIRCSAPLFDDAGLTEQLALFSKHCGAEGFQYVAEFISPALERGLLAAQQRLQPAESGPLIENRGLWRARRRRSRRCCAPKMTVGVAIGWHRDKPQFDRPSRLDRTASSASGGRSAKMAALYARRRAGPSLYDVR
jgi:hypothetical protein